MESTELVLTLEPDAVSWREVEGEVVALDLRAGDYLAINGSGALLWRALVDGASPGDLTQLLMDRFDVVHERAAADVTTFTDALDVRGLLRTEAR